jgi:hypothetical protein
MKVMPTHKRGAPKSVHYFGSLAYGIFLDGRRPQLEHPMTLAFPNASRSFDDVRKLICFTGYDGMFEVRFFVDAAALSTIRVSEQDYLRAFDGARSKIQQIALNLYNPKHGMTYTLRAADLR